MYLGRLKASYGTERTLLMFDKGKKWRGIFVRNLSALACYRRIPDGRKV